MRSLWLVLLVSCGGTKTELVRGPSRPCMETKPPLPPEGILFEACPPGDGDFAACLSKESALKLAHYLDDLQRYARDNYTQCGERK